MQEFTVRYVDGPLQGLGTVTQPDSADGPPLIQRLPLPGGETGLRRTMSDTYLEAHAIYERRGLDERSGEWEFVLVRIE